MRLVRYNGGRIGVLHDGLVNDVTQAIGANADAWPPVSMVQLINNFDALLPKITSALTSDGVPVAKVRLEAPILWPNKLIAYPVNFVEHGAERNVTLRADTNGFFLKANSSLIGPSDPIILPDLPGREFHHECELAIIVGKMGRHIDTSDALEYVFGYACLIDVTLRGKEDRVMRKSYDTFTPIGPSIVTRDEVGDPNALDLKLWVNSELRQHANTRDLILDVPNMISMASSVTTLYPGDVIASGTPAGVGPITAGDIVTIEIERVGRMSIAVEQGRGGNNLAMSNSTSR
jgi:2-keto-4-pentenoate hydratase/2-oxohepta-3-ene-1,7-dioic acid hydratase in catechol pathway